MLSTLKTNLAATHQFDNGAVQIGEPFSPPVDNTCAIFFSEWAPIKTSLATTCDVYALMVRVYVRAGMTPTDAETVETALAGAIVAIENALATDFTLGGTVRAIDFVGEEEGQRVTGKWGHVVISGTIYRCVDVSVPLIVDDSSTFAA